MKTRWLATIGLVALWVLPARVARGAGLTAVFTEDRPSNIPAELLYLDTCDAPDVAGTPRRNWELSSASAYGNRGVLTERVEVRGCWQIGTGIMHGVLSTSFGGDSETGTGLVGLHLPILSAGLRAQSANGNFWVESGLRLIIGWGGPNDSDPGSQTLALGAVLASGGDDAAWLPVSQTGVEIYGEVYARTALVTSTALDFLGGIQYGGAASLVPIPVSTWLGPQDTFIGDAHLELFLAVPKIGSWTAAHLELGTRADVSLSSIWPGNEILPVSANGFLEYSPGPVTIRVFVGTSLLLQGDGPSLQYGGRIVLRL